MDCDCDLSYLYFFCWKIFLPKLSNSHNHQLLSKGTKFQTSFFLFVFCLKLKFIFYNSKAQDQMCDWTKDFYIFLECKNLNPSLILHDSHIWFWKFLYILGCSGPQCGIPSFLVLGLGLPILIFFSYLDYDFHLHERSTINIGKSLWNEVWIFSLCYVWQWTESIFADTFFAMYYQDRKEAPMGWVR